MNTHRDILAALKSIAGDPDAGRVAKVRVKHDKQLQHFNCVSNHSLRC